MSNQEWLELIAKKSKERGCDYCMSWWLSQDAGMSTPKVNYQLKKLVKDGILTSTSHHYGIKYRINPKDPNDIIVLDETPSIDRDVIFDSAISALGYGNDSSGRLAFGDLIRKRLTSKHQKEG